MNIEIYNQIKMNNEFANQHFFFETYEFHI